MKELLEKEKELMEEIADLELAVRVLFNHGNIPLNNWKEATDKLMMRERKLCALAEIKDVKRSIELNDQPENT